MRFESVVSGGTLILPQGPVRADLAIEKGRIAALGTGFEAATRIPADGLLVLPGLVDPHVHPIHAESYGSVSEAAIRGGVTTLGHHLYTPPDGDPLAYFEASVAEAAAETRVDFVFHVRLNDLQRTQPAIHKLIGRGSTTFKLFLAYGSRGVMVRDDEVVLAMQAAAEAGGTLLFHAENGHVADLLEAQARVRGERGLSEYYAARPRWVEAEAVERVIALVRLTNCPSYLVHLTCRESLEAVRHAKAGGLPVIAETCPHYLLLTAEEAAAMGARAKMSPPLREATDRDALWQALDQGLVDTIGSDHSAFARHEKEVDDVFEAGYGVPGIATMLPLLFDRGVRSGRISLATLVAALATNPARALQLSDRKGCLGVGADADFVLFDPEAPFRIGATSEGPGAYYSLYDGWTGRGAVVASYQRGRPLLVDGEILAGAGQGSWLRRETPPETAG